MTFDPRTELLSTYPADAFTIECIRCRRHAPVERYQLQRRYGDITLQECALKIAAQKGCALASLPGAQCSVTVFEVPFWTWARLRDAKHGGWQARMICRRKYAGLKSTDSCPGHFDLDIDTLVAALGDEFEIEKLRRRARCPRCHTESVSIEWYRPDPPKDPAPSAEAPVLRLRPTPAALDRQKFAVIERKAGRR